MFWRKSRAHAARVAQDKRKHAPRNHVAKGPEQLERREMVASSLLDMMLVGGSLTAPPDESREEVRRSILPPRDESVNVSQLQAALPVAQRIPVLEENVTSSHIVAADPPEPAFVRQTETEIQQGLLSSPLAQAMTSEALSAELEAELETDGHTAPILVEPPSEEAEGGAGGSAGGTPEAGQTGDAAAPAPDGSKPAAASTTTDTMTLSASSSETTSDPSSDTTLAASSDTSDESTATSDSTTTSTSSTSTSTTTSTEEFCGDPDPSKCVSDLPTFPPPSALLWVDPLFVWDASDGITLVPDSVEHEYSTWAVDLRAGVSGNIVSSHSWDLSQAPEAVNVTGQGTHRLQFTWGAFQGAARTNQITVTTTQVDSSQHVQTLTFLVEPTDMMGQVPPKPTSAATWPTVVTPDQILAEQELIEGQDYAISPVTGALYASHSLPSYNPGVAPLTLVYSSLAADVRPIFLDRYQLDPAQAVPTRVSAQATLNGVQGDVKWYDTSLLNPGGVLQIALQMDGNALPTGRYNYSIDITAHYPVPVSVTHSGQVNIINGDTWKLGDGWSIAGLQRVHAVTGGVILEMGAGLSLWFADGAQSGTYVTPAGEFSTLVRNQDNSWTRTLKDGTKINFRASDGRQTSVVDRNNNTFTLNYDPVLTDQLVSIVDPNGVPLNLAYANGLVSSFTDVAGRVTGLGRTSGRLTLITQPDNATWGYSYDTATSLMTGLTNPRSHGTAFAFGGAGRLATVTRADNTTEGLVPYQTRGLALAPYGTQTNPAVAVLAAEAQATYTDPRGFDWKSRYDWKGFGLGTQFADPLGNLATAHVNAQGLVWLENDPLNRRVYREFDSKANPLKQVLPDNNKESWLWNSFSQPTRYTNPRGYSTDMAYSATGNLERITNAMSHEIVMTHTPDGLVSTIQNQLGKVTSLSWDSRDRLEEIEHPDDDQDANNNPFVAFTYNTASNLTSYRNERGFVTATTFDLLNRPLVVTLPDTDGDPANNPKYTTVYDAYGNPTSVADPLNHTRTSTFDVMNRVSTFADALNNTTTLTWTANGDIASSRDPLNRLTQFGYDNASRNTSVMLPEPTPGAGSPVITMGYDAASQRVSVTDPINRTWTTAYALRGWVSSVTDPLGNQVAFSRDANGNLIGRADGANTPTPNTTGYFFDSLDRMFRFDTPLGESTSFGYNAANELVSRTSAQNFVTTWTRNARGWVTSETAPDPDAGGPLTSAVTTYELDAAGNRVATIDPLNRRWETVFDAQDRPVEWQDPRGGVTRVTFDLAGRRTELVDPVNNVTRWGFDDADRMVSETDPRNSVRTLVYNAASEVTSSTDRNGRKILYTHDGLGRRTKEEWLDASQNVIHTINTVYNAASEVTSASDAFSSYAFGYDLAGRVTSVDNNGTPGMPGVVLTHGYDAYNNRTSRSDNFGSGASTAWTFNKNKMVTNVSMTVGTSTAQAALRYDADRRLTRIARNSDGVSFSGEALWTDLTYDNADRVKRIAHSSYAGGQMGRPPLNAFDYTWNAASEVTGYTGPEGSLTYTHDTTSQLTGVSGARSESYSHDLNGNRTMAGYQTGTGNRLLSDGVYNYDHDNEGNLVVQTRISDGQRTEFTWDHRNRLTKVLVKDSAGAVLREARFTYDVFDRLLGRWIDMDGAGPQVPSELWTLYDGDDPYIDFDGAGNLKNRYLYGPAIDMILARISAAGAVNYYLTDLIGSVRQIVTKSGLDVLDALTYESYGKVLTETNPANGDRFKFTAREWEAAIDQYFYRARWYDPRTGRFTGEDPIGFASGDANLSRYVGNNPVASSDPTGLTPIGNDPQAQQDYANLLWANATPGGGGSGGGFLGNLASIASGLGFDVMLMAKHPLATMGGYYTGQMHGSAMIANAATFHQINSLNNYVNQVVQQNGGLYHVANFSAHVGVYAGYSAAGAWAWGAAGMPTWGIGVGPGHPYYVHFIFGAGQGGSMTWMQGVAGGWIVGAPSATVGGMWFTVTGIPILFPAAAVSGNYAWNCFTAACHSFFKGWFKI